MKTFFLTTIIAVFFVLSTNRIQAQTSQTKLDQVEFMKNFFGSWTAEWGKDTILNYNARPFGKGSERDWTLSTKGKIFDSGKILYGYDAVNDKLIEVNLYKSTPNIILNAWWVTSNTTFEGVPLKDISNPKNAAFRFNCVIKSPDLFVMTYFMNNNVVGTYTFTRVRK
jgi:hypothetical protein